MREAVEETPVTANEVARAIGSPEPLSPELMDAANSLAATGGLSTAEAASIMSDGMARMAMSAAEFAKALHQILSLGVDRQLEQAMKQAMGPWTEEKPRKKEHYARAFIESKNKRRRR